MTVRGRFRVEQRVELAATWWKGFELLGAVNTGRVSAYAGDGSSEHAEFWREMELAQARYRVNQTMDFFVEASRGTTTT